FGWDDMTVIKLGYEWEGDNDMTWRLGYSKTDQPIGNDDLLFNILAPGVIEQHYTFGFTKALDQSSAFNFALMYAPNVAVSGTNTFDPTQTIEIDMDQYEIAASYSRSF
ncbi:MAG: hypothetical protein OEY09_13925, partial [Gammaproteobacteria bacterium]|nr:hypothetical protein [Gammaproteobacteria bacterium]